MKILKISAMLLTVFTLSAHADSALKFPQTIVCENPDAPSMPLKFYTRLENIESLEQIPDAPNNMTLDQGAAKSGTEYRVAINKDLYTYDVWNSFDSWSSQKDLMDYFYSFRTSLLIEPASSTIASKAIVGMQSAEVRDYQKFTRPLKCQAQY